MRSYIKNKNFISEKFYNNVKEKIIKKENDFIIIFLIINIIFFPITLRCIKEFQDKTINNKVVDNSVNKSVDGKSDMPDDNKSSIDLEEIKNLVDISINDYIIESNLTKDESKIIVDSFNTVCKIDSDNRIKVDNLHLNDSENYVFGVKLNE